MGRIAASVRFFSFCHKSLSNVWQFRHTCTKTTQMRYRHLYIESKNVAELGFENYELSPTETIAWRRSTSLFAFLKSENCSFRFVDAELTAEQIGRLDCWVGMARERFRGDVRR